MPKYDYPEPQRKFRIRMGYTYDRIAFKDCERSEKDWGHYWTFTPSTITKNDGQRHGPLMTKKKGWGSAINRSISERFPCSKKSHLVPRRKIV